MRLPTPFERPSTESHDSPILPGLSNFYNEGAGGAVVKPVAHHARQPRQRHQGRSTQHGKHSDTGPCQDDKERQDADLTEEHNHSADPTLETIHERRHTDVSSVERRERRTVVREPSEQYRRDLVVPDE